MSGRHGRTKSRDDAGDRAISKRSEQIARLELAESAIDVAEHLTTMSPRAMLVERLQQATQRGQLRIEQRGKGEN